MEAPLEILGVIRHPYHTCTLHGNRCGRYMTPVTVTLCHQCMIYAFLTVSANDMLRYRGGGVGTHIIRKLTVDLSKSQTLYSFGHVVYSMYMCAKEHEKRTSGHRDIPAHCVQQQAQVHQQ